jgi:predicted nucleic acid-binding protein
MKDSMAKNSSSISKFEPKGSNTFLLDTNMWMYLLSPIGSYKPTVQDAIGRFIENCIRVKATLLTNSFIVSEFYHVNLGLSFDQWKLEQKSSAKFQLKRDYRPTDHYKESIAAIVVSIKKLITLSSRFPDDFNSIDIDSILGNSMYAEFNDNYLLELCNTRNYIIVTNDNDLISHPYRRAHVLTII